VIAWTAPTLEKFQHGYRKALLLNQQHIKHADANRRVDSLFQCELRRAFDGTSNLCHLVREKFIMPPFIAPKATREMGKVDR